MSFLNFLFPRRPAASAGIAKERLQIVLAHERAGRDVPSFLPQLQRDLLAVVGRYVAIKEELLRVNFARQNDTTVLEINVAIDPASAPPRPAQELNAGTPQRRVRHAPPQTKLVGKKR
jgi:cell division topological specificity factor